MHFTPFFILMWLFFLNCMVATFGGTCLVVGYVCVLLKTFFFLFILNYQCKYSFISCASTVTIKTMEINE